MQHFVNLYIFVPPYIIWERVEHFLPLLHFPSQAAALFHRDDRLPTACASDNFCQLEGLGENAQMY